MEHVCTQLGYRTAVDRVQFAALRVYFFIERIDSVEQETFHRIIVLIVSLAIEIGFLRIVVYFKLKKKTYKLIFRKIILILYSERKKIIG